VFYIFHGEDEFSRAEALACLRGQLAEGDPTMADLNTTFLDGTKVTLGELRHVCDTIPFMGERRMVIVQGLLGWLSAGGGKDQETTQGAEPARKRALMAELAAYLPILPSTTRLIFVEDKKLPASHPILKVANAEKGGHVKVFEKPGDGNLSKWIQQRVRAEEGTIDHEAVAVLAALVGSDLRLLVQELEKLLLYADGHPITAQDVGLLVSRARETSIFDLVDCVARRQTDRALRLLHRLLDDGEPPLYLLTMLARQVRILIQVHELGKQGLSEAEMARRLGLHPYVIKKGVSQARSFSMTQLELAHQHLVKTDWSIKTGKVEEVLALDTLVVNLTQI
jgi:DNA polymerase-3 subunit delta